MNRILPIIAACAMLGGCATTAPQITDASMMVAAPGRYAVTVERGRHAGINSVPFAIYVDGAVAAKIDGGRAVTLYVTTGRHLIGVQSAKRADSGPSDEIAVDVSAKKQPILRTNVDAWGYGGIKISRVE